MPDRRARPGTELAPVVEGELLPVAGSAAVMYQHALRSLTASAQVLTYQNTADLTIPPREWQVEAWGFYSTLGEVNFAIGVWLANCMSRVRLVAATRPAGSDDPVPLTEGPHADLVANLAGGITGQAAMMRRLAVQLSVPGESYLVLEDTPERGRTTRVYSSSELRLKSRGSAGTRYDALADGFVTYEVMVDRASWRNLSPESLVCRIWQPNDQFAWAASSVMFAALPICREVDFYNRYIIAILLSRLAMNGILLIPTEATLAVKEQYKDAPDPFMAELIDIASQAIKNPGTAAAAVPIPIRMDADMIEKVKHLTFSTDMSEHVLENRKEALQRLAVSLNVPTEVVTGMKDINHWGQWQLEESGIKIYISPLAEVVVAGLQEGWFAPTCEALGLPLEIDGDPVFVWYETTELTETPDKSGIAHTLYGDGALNTLALLRESGFDSQDLPSLEELKQIALTRIAMAGGADALTALSHLTGDASLVPPAPAPTPPGTPGAAPAANPGPAPAAPPAQGQRPGDAPKGPPARPGAADLQRGLEEVFRGLDQLDTARAGSR